MTTLTTRPYAGEADLPRMVELINDCEAVDRLDQGVSIVELREELSDPTIDLTRDIRLWEDGDGMLVALGRIGIPRVDDELCGFLGFKVHPSARGNGIETEIFSWAAERMRQVGCERGAKVRLRAGSITTDAQRIGILEAHGFTPARYFTEMSCSLAAPLPDPQLPHGFTIRHLAGAEEVPAWVELFNLSFIDHWEHYDLTVEQRLHWLTESYYRPEDDLIAVADDGTFAAFCKCMVVPEQNQRTGRNEGWISLLGTRRGYRNIGLGRAMLLAGLHRLQVDGCDRALLGVDAASPTGANRLYESVGFHAYRTFAAFVKDLDDAA